MGVIVKSGFITNDTEYHNPADDVVLRSDEVIIKRYRLNYTIPQKVRLGMLPYSALEEYERQKALEAEAKAQAEAEEAARLAEEEAKAAENSSEDKPKKNHTFWEDDDGNRENMSQEDFEKFLAANSITLNNPMDMIAGMLDQ